MLNQRIKRVIAWSAGLARSRQLRRLGTLLTGVFSALKTPATFLGNLLLGEKLADGVVVRFWLGRPSIHVLNTDVKSTLQSLRDHARKLPDCIERYNILQGFTPSKQAFKVCELILRKHMGGDREAVADLKRISDEAAGIDLKRPTDAAWKREMRCSIGGVSTRITISLSRVSMFDRLVTRIINTDLSRESLANRYGYQVALRPETAASTLALAPIRRLFRKAAEISVMVAPMAVVGFSVSQGAIAKVASNITQNQLLRGALVDVMQFSSLALAGAITFLVTQRLNRARLCPGDKSTSSQ